MHRSAAFAVTIFVAVPAFAQQQVPAIDGGGKPRSHRSDTMPQSEGAVTFPPQVQVGVPVQPLTKRQRAAVKLSKKRLNDKLMPTTDRDGSVVYMYGHTYPDLVCAPQKWCAVRLEKGEVIVGADGNPAGAIMLTGKDTWFAKPMAYGSRKEVITEVMVSPKFPDTQAQAVFGTNKGRRYVINLRSTAHDYMPMISFSYPDDDVKVAGTAYVKAVGGGAEAVGGVGSAGGVDIAALDFNFEIDGDAPFRPAAVYTDGARTVIEFGHDVRDLPVLVGIGDDGGIFSDPSRYVLNSKMIGARKLLVDGVFNRAALVAGTGGSQKEVLIRRGS